MNAPKSIEMPSVFCNNRRSELKTTQKFKDSDIPSLAKTHLYALCELTWESTYVAQKQ